MAQARLSASPATTAQDRRQDHHLQVPSQPARDCSGEYKSMPRELRDQNSPDQINRASFSSIREDQGDLTQLFTTSKTSVYAPNEDAVEDPTPTAPREDAAASNDGMAVARFHPPLTHPQSRLHGTWSTNEVFQGWKQIHLSGKTVSKSFDDLQVLGSLCSTAPKTPPGDSVACEPGGAPLEKLPAELLRAIIDLLVPDIPSSGISRRNIDLMSLLLVSRRLYSATLVSLYRQITIPHSRIFHKFLSHISAHPALGEIVRRLDFCHFNPSLLFFTAAERSQARNLTRATLLQCLHLTPNLREFLAQEYLEDDLDASVLRKLFLGLPRLDALDFCGCSSATFRDAFSSTIAIADWPAELSITRLSFHKCLTLPASVFEAILPRLKRLTHLDVADTRITESALASIPASATITHLNLAKCSLLSAQGVIDFLAKHPSVSEKLTFLSLATDARSHQLLDVDDISKLLPILPSTLRSLSLKGSKMDAAHVDLLRPLMKHLEELVLGRALGLEDINRLFVPDEDDDDDDDDDDDVSRQLAWVPQSLKYIDLSDLWGGELDLCFLFGRQCALLTKLSAPLEVIEVADEVFRRFIKSPAVLRRAGWRTSECGSRTWLVRIPEDERRPDDGFRDWKMGAENWGMRKVPVARTEVGGVCGSYMFSRKL